MTQFLSKLFITIFILFSTVIGYSQQDAGSFDSSFYAYAGNLIECVTIQHDNKILIGGVFDNYNGTYRNKLARINPEDGSLDTSFVVGVGFQNTSNVSPRVFSIELQSDDKLIVAGRFANYNGYPAGSILRINTDGSADDSFLSIYIGHTYEQYIRTTAIQEDGKILVGGYFSIPSISSDLVNIARLNSDGTLDTSFNTGSGLKHHAIGGNSVYDIVLQPDGKILAGGGFSRYDGQVQNSITRLNPDGSLDTSFDIGTGFYGAVSSAVNVIALQDDGKILAGGGFTSYNGQAVNRLVRLNPDGSLDTSFDIGTGFPDYINSLAIQPDGKILVGGRFTSYNGETQNYLVRLNPDGTRDTSFDIGSGFSGGAGSTNVLDIALQSDGKILTVGNFSTFNGSTQNNHIARLNGVSTVSVKDMEMSKVKIYPNPTQDFINISSNGIIRSITLNNILGSMVYESRYNDEEATIDISTFPKGMYLITVTTDNSQETVKILKK